ncbi:BnaA03g60720D [Brassica napus]|uniref:BnaA03g60720D protein n=1 Tax=Brassica napus TaxID=3708 RepID=A0A078IAF1_BRANA|nr:BnaA03g60720D [Brassica napus]
MGKLATTLDDFVPSSSSVPCWVEDHKVSSATSSVSRGGLSEFIWPSVAVVSGRVKLRHKTGSSSRAVFCLGKNLIMD